MLCKNCKMPMLKEKFDEYKPIWYCAMCETTLDRNTFWKSIGEGLKLIFDPNVFFPIVVVGGFCYLIGGCCISCNESIKADTEVRTYMVFYSPIQKKYIAGRQEVITVPITKEVTEKLIDRIAEKAKKTGEYSKVIDIGTNWLKVKASKNTLPSYAELDDFYIDTVREATKYD